MLSRELFRTLTRPFAAKLMRYYSLRRAGQTQQFFNLKANNLDRPVGSIHRLYRSMREAESNAQEEEKKVEVKSEEKKQEQSPEEEHLSQELSEESAISELQDELSAKQQEIQELKETLEKKNTKEKELLKEIQYLAAERNNLVTRYKKQLGDAQVYAISKFAKDIVEVRDNLQRAMDIQVPQGEERDIEKLEEHYNNLKQGKRRSTKGVELTAKSLDAILKRNKIEVINPEGEDFDPKLHDAMYEFPDKDKKNGKVGKVLRTGWKIGDRVLRSATVGVVKNVN